MREEEKERYIKRPLKVLGFFANLTVVGLYGALAYLMVSTHYRNDNYVVPSILATIGLAVAASICGGHAFASKYDLHSEEGTWCRKKFERQISLLYAFFLAAWVPGWPLNAQVIFIGVATALMLAYWAWSLSNWRWAKLNNQLVEGKLS